MSIFPIDREEVSKIRKELGINQISRASIRQVVQLADRLEKQFGLKFIRTEMGVPGIPAPAIGVEAEIEALKSGVASVYPPIQGVDMFKNELSRFAKKFLDVDISPVGCIPTAGGMQASAISCLAANRRDKSKDTTLFIDPGFPVQKRMMGVLGMKFESFDIYDFRGDKLEDKLETYLRNGNISTILYNSPNNPSWISMTERELEIIGRMANKYDVVVMEDLAYFGMDFRHGKTEGPLQSTVAKFTNNYILLFSSSKIFSYAGQRIGGVMISDKLFSRRFEDLSRFFVADQLGPALLQEVVYTMSAGISHSAQYGVARILKAANDGEFNFVEYLHEYGRRASSMKERFVSNGFYLVYDQDEGEPIGDGFYFTVAYPGMNGEDLLSELICYGITAITLDTTGSTRTEGLRISVSHTTAERMDDLAERLRCFACDHKLESV